MFDNPLDKTSTGVLRPYFGQNESFPDVLFRYERSKDESNVRKNVHLGRERTGKIIIFQKWGVVSASFQRHVRMQNIIDYSHRFIWLESYLYQIWVMTWWIEYNKKNVDEKKKLNDTTCFFSGYFLNSVLFLRPSTWCQPLHCSSDTSIH